MERFSARPLVLMPHEVGANIFMPEIIAGYGEAGYDVVVGRENLAYSLCSPSLVHIHWPEEHFNWGGEAGTPETRASNFLKRLDQLKARGTRIVWEVHNLSPHESVSVDLETRIYAELIDRCDLLVHHCEESVRLLKERYVVRDSIRTVVTPLGNYLAYPNTSTRPSARRHLKLPEDRLVFLHFGAVRAYKGLDLLLEAFSMAKVPKKLMMVAGRYVETKSSERWRDRIEWQFKKRFGPNLRFDLRMIPDNEVQFYLNAADVVVLAQRWSLNSGVAVLGMTFGRPVIGPRCGCIGPELDGVGGNITYEPGSARALARAMEQAASMDRGAAGARNRAGVAQWKWGDTAKAVARAFA